MNEGLFVVGKRMPRWDAPAKATGAAKYTVDLKLPGMLIGKVLTSPLPHARIVRIDTSKAEKLPGVRAVITFGDVPQTVFNPNKGDLTLFHPEGELKDMYVLSDKARFVGDRIAAVAAVDAMTADEALRLIDVEYEALPAVFDAVEAMKPGAAKVHDSAESNIALHMQFPVSWGDVGKGFEEADCVVQETYWTARNHVAQLEPCACIAGFGPDDRLTIWSPSQHVFPHRKKIAQIFGMQEGMIKWITPHIGGSFGKYGSLSLEPVAVALARKSGKPVKIELSREQDLMCTELRQRYITAVKVGVRKDGVLTALDESIIVDGGAYFTHNSSTTGVNMGCFAGLYRCPNVDARADCVYTNLPVAGGVRGYGDSEATCVLEQTLDKAAKQLGMDPLELRLKNVKKARDLANTGIPLDTCSLEEIIKLGAEKIGWKEKRERPREAGTKRRGIGMGIMMDVSGAQPFNIQIRNAFIKFNEDASINLSVCACDMGQNLQGAMAQMAAEVLGIDYRDVHVISGDTDSTLFDTGQNASGGCYQLGNAVIKAAEEAKQQLLERAAKKLGAATGELDVRNGEVYVVSNPKRAVSIAEVSKEAAYSFEGEHLSICGKGTFSPTKNPPPFSAAFADVEVDTETGVVRVVKIVYVFDCGKAINPTTVEGQLQGGVAQSVGYALTEDYVVDTETGRLQSDNYNTYKLPSALDMPEIEVHLYEDPAPSGPFGARGVGHGTMVAVTPAIFNAIYDATGVLVTEAPATPERILAALKKNG